MKLKTYNDYAVLSIIIAVFIICILIAIYILNPFQIPICFFISKLGIYCPACGATRAFLSLLNFDILESIYYNPIVVYSVISIFIYLILYFVFKLNNEKEDFLFKYAKFCLYIGIFITILNFAIRNVLLHVWNIQI